MLHQFFSQIDDPPATGVDVFSHFELVIWLKLVSNSDFDRYYRNRCVSVDSDRLYSRANSLSFERKTWAFHEDPREQLQRLQPYALNDLYERQSLKIQYGPSDKNINQTISLHPQLLWKLSEFNLLMLQHCGNFHLSVVQAFIFFVLWGGNRRLGDV